MAGKTNKVIQKHIEENYKQIEAYHVGKTVSSFKHVERQSTDDVNACRYNALYRKTRFAPYEFYLTNYKAQ